MKLRSPLLGLVSASLFVLSVLATRNSLVERDARSGPEWFRSFSLFAGTPLFLAALVLLAEFGRRNWSRPIRSSRGVRTAILGGCIGLAGVLWTAQALDLRAAHPLIGLKIGPPLACLGLAIVPMHLVARAKPGGSTLGGLTLRFGLLLLVAGGLFLFVPDLISEDQGFAGFVIGADCVPGGATLLILGGGFRRMERRRLGAEDQFA